MKQHEFNKLTKQEITALLKKYPEGQGVALDVLGKAAKAWHTYRKHSGQKRIVDPNTGRWASEFTANGTKYYIRSPEEGVGMKRYPMLKKMLSVVGFDATYGEQIAALNRIATAANTLVTKAPRLDTLFAEIENMKQAIARTERRFDSSYYAACLFVVTSGEDLTEWSEAEAEKKIEDWQKEGIHEHDFFLLVMLWGSQLSAKLTELSGLINRQVAARPL